MNIDTLYKKIGRDVLVESGISTQCLTDAKANGYLPATWFDIVEGVCVDRGIKCPRTLFNFKPKLSKKSKATR